MQCIYNHTREALLSWLKRMSLPSSCSGVHQWKASCCWGSVKIFTTSTLVQTLVFAQLKNTVWKHTREYNKARDRVGSRCQCCCAWDDDSRPLKGLPSGGGKGLSPLGLSVWANMGKNTCRQTSSCCMIPSRVYVGTYVSDFSCTAFPCSNCNIKTCFPAPSFFILSIRFNNSTILCLSSRALTSTRWWKRAFRPGLGSRQSPGKSLPWLVTWKDFHLRWWRHAASRKQQKWITNNP